MQENIEECQKCSRCSCFYLIEFFDGFKTCRKCRRYKQDYRDFNIFRELVQSAKDRAKLKNLDFNLTKQYIESIVPIGNICPIRNVVMHIGNYKDRNDSFSIDRIDSTKGYVIGNVNIISYLANKIKFNCSLEELELFFNFKHPKIHNTDNETMNVIIKERNEFILNNKQFMNKRSIRAALNLERSLLVKAKKRSKENNLIIDIDENYIKSIFPLDNCCAIFGNKFIFNGNMLSASIDRIDTNLGYIKGNVQILSRRANMVKHNCSMEELYFIIRSFRDYYNGTGTGIIL